MPAQQLNVRVGLLFDEKSLAGIEKSMRASGQRLSRIGSDLSLSLSLPLAAFGVTAIKSAGDIESLTLALKSQLGTADAAAKEFDKLNEAAKKPGLGLEQAVRGSVRLQGVGFAADEARKVLIEMGNAIAATGGSAQELDNVTRQFAQMTSKGRVLQEDVSILSENMPGLAQLMQKAFGTQSVEAIRNMGVSGKEFVLQITKAAEGIDRVDGGIKNGIGNAIDSLKQSAAKVGLAINEAFDVTGSIETLSKAVLYLAQGFANLDPWVKKIILGIAGVAIATGPVIKAWGAIQLLGSQMVSLWSGLVGVGGRLVTGLQTIATAFNALNLATRAFILIGVVAAVVSLVSAFANYQSQLSDTEKAQLSLLDADKKAADSIAGQKSEVDTLVNAYKQEGTTLKQKQEILKELNRISPEYFGGIRAGKGDIEAITIATGKYSAELLRVAKITAYKDRLVEIERATLDLNKASEPSTLQTLGNAILSGGHALQFASKQAASYTNNVNTAKAALEKEKEALLGAITAQTLADAANGTLSKSTKNYTSNVHAATKAVKELKAAVGVDEKPKPIEITTIPAKPGGLVSSETPQQLPEILPTSQVNTISAAQIALEKYAAAAAYAAEIQKQLSEGTFNFQTGLSEVVAKLTEQGNLMGSVYAAMGDAIAKAAADGQTSFASLGKAAVGAAAKIVRAYIQQGVAAAVAKALSSLPFPLNLAAGAAAGGIAAALFTKAIGAIGVKGFARGTNFAPGGTALVGEQGPELINLPRGSKVFPTPQTNQMLSNMGGGSVNVGGEFTIKGTDLVLVLERAQRSNERYR